MVKRVSHRLRDSASGRRGKFTQPRKHFLAYYVYSIVSEKPLPVPASDKRSELLQTISDRRIATEHFEAAEDGRVFHEVDELWTETQ